MNEKPGLWTLFSSFFKIGLFTFGGGYAMIPLIEDVCVDRRGWITAEELARVVVIAESTPGPVAINCATFVGNKSRGVPGAFAATFGVVLPSFLIILALSLFLGRIFELPLAARAFRGVRIAVSILILSAGVRMFRRAGKKPLSLALIAASALSMLAINVFSLPVSTITLLAAAGAISLTACLIKGREDGK